MNLKNLNEILAKEPKFRFKQVFDAIFRNLAEDWDDVSNLPKELIANLKEKCSLHINADIINDHGGDIKKAVITLDDGLKVESVLMRNKYGKNTICISSQVGCPVGCVFCATGNMGFKRNLKAEEIILQVILFARILKKQEDSLDRVVFMGMGEPFLNWEEVKKVIDFLHDEDKFNIGFRHISVSTIGITEGIRKLVKEFPQINLAVSIHSANDKKRGTLTCINDRYNLRRMQKAVQYYLDMTNRKVFFEYVMLNGINDKEDDARELIDYIKGFDKRHLIYVNLIAYNKISGEFKASNQENQDKFKNILEKAHVGVSIRKSFGSEITGACGQLKSF